MSAVEVPADLIERAAEMIHNCGVDWHAQGSEDRHSGDYPDCGNRSCVEHRLLYAALRALLPQPAPTCPNCEHVPVGHGDSGCLASACDCPFSHPAVMVALALLAAERDSKPDRPMETLAVSDVL